MKDLDVVVCLDDLLIMGNDKQSHMQNLEKVCIAFRIVACGNKNPNVSLARGRLSI